MEKMPLVLKIYWKLIDFFLSQHFAKLETNCVSWLIVGEVIVDCLGVEDVFAVGAGYFYGDVNVVNLIVSCASDNTAFLTFETAIDK